VASCAPAGVYPTKPLTAVVRQPENAVVFEPAPNSGVCDRNL
jgi:hypothetical protein